MSAPIYTGVYPVLATPFDDRGKIDEESLRRLVRFVLESGADGLTVGGVASEVYKLSEPERERTATIVLEETGRAVPVWVGTGHSCAELAVELSTKAEALGAAGVMVMPPFAMRPTLAGVGAYFRAIARAVKVPVMVQDAPLVSNVHLPADFLAGLAGELDTLRYVKLEAPPTGPKISDLLRKAGGKLAVFGGLGGMNMTDEFKRGAVGTLPGSAFPEVHVEIWRRFRDGDVAGAEEVHRRFLPLLRFCSQSVEFSFHAYKEILRRRGVLRSAYVRQPSTTFDDGERAELEALLGTRSAKGSRGKEAGPTHETRADSPGRPR